MPTMTGLLSLLATGVLVALGLWLLGGVVLRVGGVLLVAGGLLSTAATGSPSAALVTLLGAVAWLCGQWHYGARHHCFSSPLARRVFHEALPGSLTPPGGGACPTCRRRGGRAQRGCVARRGAAQCPPGAEARRAGSACLGGCDAVAWAGGALRFDGRDELAERVQPRHDRDPLVSVACRGRVPEQSAVRCELAV